VDRQLPFLCVYRLPPEGDETGTERLVQGEASYLLASGDRRSAHGVSSLVAGVAGVMTKAFGAFLIVEVWAGPADSGAEPYQPAFRVHHSRRIKTTSTVETLVQALGGVRTKRNYAEVDVCVGSRSGPPGLPNLVSPTASPKEWHLLGVEVRPVYWDAKRKVILPLIRRALHRNFSIAIKRSVFDFTRKQTRHRPPHYQALGRRSLVKAVWEIDSRLAEVSNTFDFLMLVSPTNTDAAWSAFQRNRFRIAPEFTYRPLPIDPPVAKRQLFRVPLERIEDPTLAQLFRDQQSEIERKLTLLGDRGSARFLYGSLQLFGGVDKRLATLARRLLDEIPRRARNGSGKQLDAKAFRVRARKELEYYRDRYPELTSSVYVRDDVSGLMVSRGNLLIGKQLSLPESRADALLSHEIGTHVLTYFNGRAQPFKQLYVGLPNYEELQEGLAVFSEYLVGGLSRPRLRLLAARVLAVRRLIEGATFVEVFRELVQKHGLAQRASFGATMRVFRCGGFTKDVVYLRGLANLLEYLANGGDLETLFVGKFGSEHVPIIKELQWRRVLGPPPLRPRYLDFEGVQDRLQRVRAGVSVIDLLEE
jgi:uncharacterized protein (TIGR02421 family)